MKKWEVYNYFDYPYERVVVEANDEDEACEKALMQLKTKWQVSHQEAFEVEENVTN